MSVLFLREMRLLLNGARLVLRRLLPVVAYPTDDDRIGQLLNDERSAGEILTTPSRSGTVLCSYSRVGEQLVMPRVGVAFEVTE